jgi:hypothetical protein
MAAFAFATLERDRGPGEDAGGLERLLVRQPLLAVVEVERIGLHLHRLGELLFEVRAEGAGKDLQADLAAPGLDGELQQVLAPWPFWIFAAGPTLGLPPSWGRRAGPRRAGLALEAHGGRGAGPRGAGLALDVPRCREGPG